MIEIKNVTFSYGEEHTEIESGRTDQTNEKNGNGIHELSLEIKDGECVVLCGESGCGKTTVTRLINGLIPHYYEGKLTGSVTVNGAKVSEQPLYDTAQLVGSVFQNPRSQFFNVDTTSELSFGCENLGMEENSIRERLEQTVREFRLDPLMNRSIFELSGGEKQKIACAGAAMMEPEVYVLDEPSSNLDVSAIRDLRNTLAEWKKQGRTIVISEHRLYYLKGIADRFVYLKDGRIEKCYTAAAFEELTCEQRAEMGLRTFSLEDVKAETAILQGKTFLEDGKSEAAALHEKISTENTNQKAAASHGKTFIELRNFQFAYKGGRQVLDVADCKIPAQKIVGIIGHNGAGKSTFSRCLCGLEKKCGEIVWNGKKYRPKDRLNLCYMVMQDVNHQLFTESVKDEVEVSMEREDEQAAEQILEKLDLGACQDRHPMSLSGGQKQRVAIASAVASRRQIMIFDEPTSGLDYKHMREAAQVLKKLCENGMSLYIITHDVELIAACCTDVIHLEEGQIKEQYALDEKGIAKIREFFQN